MKNSKRNGNKKVTFSFQADPGKKIFVAGTFNAWAPDKARLKDHGNGEYTVALNLPVDRHQYKFVVDGEWCADPLNPETIPNDRGSSNSVIVVG